MDNLETMWMKTVALFPDIIEQSSFYKQSNSWTLYLSLSAFLLYQKQVLLIVKRSKEILFTLVRHQRFCSISVDCCRPPRTECTAGKCMCGMNKRELSGFSTMCACRGYNGRCIMQHTCARVGLVIITDLELTLWGEKRIHLFPLQSRRKVKSKPILSPVRDVQERTTGTNVFMNEGF
jgi:hypothetical protein